MVQPPAAVTGAAPVIAAAIDRQEPATVLPPSTAMANAVPAATADATLAAACRARRPGALERLVERYQRDVFGSVLRLVRDREVAAELANSIFYKVYERISDYDPTRPLRPWLLRIATNEALNWLRAQRRDRERLLAGDAGDAALAQLPGGVEPEPTAIAAEERALVHAALARLPERYRVVLVLRFFNNLSYQEIAEVTGQDANAVGVQLLRARQLLRRELEQERSAGPHSDASAPSRSLSSPAPPPGSSPARPSMSAHRLPEGPSGPAPASEDSSETTQ